MNEFALVYWATIITSGLLFSLYIASDMISYLIAVIKRATKGEIK